jgi:uncharacterized membrane protein
MHAFEIEARTKLLLQKYLLRGLALSIPGIITISLLTAVCGLADKLLGPFTRLFIRIVVPSWMLVGPFKDGDSSLLSFIFLLVLLTTGGAFVSWKYGERMVRAFEGLLIAVPGIGYIYQSTQKLSEVLDTSKKNAFQRMVLIPYPHAGCLTIGFVSGTTVIGQNGQEVVHLRVVIPAPPTGVQGIVLVKESDAIDIPMDVDDGIQFYVSLGTVAPERIDISEEANA